MFNIDRDLVQKLRTGRISPRKLVLEQTATANGRVWRIRTIKEANASPDTGVTKRIAFGAAVVEILRTAANGRTLPKHLSELTKNQRFRVFARQVPGMETSAHEHAASHKLHASLAERMGRIRNALRTMSRGAAAMEAQQKPWRMVDTDYILQEVLNKDPTLPATFSRKMTELWKESDTQLSFQEWVNAATKEWRTSGSSQDLLPWLTSREWQRRERKAWESEHPGVTFTAAAFAAWQKSQHAPDSLFPEPEWYLKEACHHDNERSRKQGRPELTFEAWKKNEVEGRKKYWEWAIKEFPHLFPYSRIDDSTFRFLDSLMFKDFLSGSTMDNRIFVAKEIWRASNPPDLSDAAFISHIEYQQCTYEERDRKIQQCKANIARLREQVSHCSSGASGRAKRATLNSQIDINRRRIEQLEKHPEAPTEAIFLRWKRNRDAQLHARWQATRTTLPFAQWKAQQVLDPLVPVPFVRLSAVARQHYRTDCANGVLIRNGQPFPTTEERTAHSGRGWVIFVMGPTEDLYCASHLPGVFHHSSFLGDAATMAAGEIRTDTTGRITHISSKSGHYKPTTAENRAMLQWFESRGVNLSRISFTYFTADGPSAPISARDYMNSTA